MKAHTNHTAAPIVKSGSVIVFLKMNIVELHNSRKMVALKSCNFARSAKMLENDHFLRDLKRLLFLNVVIVFREKSKY